MAEFDKLATSGLSREEFLEQATALLCANGFGDDLETVLEPALGVADRMRDGEITREEFVTEATALLRAEGLGDDLLSLSLGEITLEFSDGGAPSSSSSVADSFKVFYRRYTALIDELLLLKQVGVASGDTAIVIAKLPREASRQRDTLSAVLKHCRTFGQLLEVTVSLTDAAIDESVLRTFLQQIDWCQVTKLKGYNNVSTKGRLTDLDLSRSTVDDLAAKAIAAFCPGLRRLKLVGCAPVGDEGVESIAKFCHNLREVDVSGCGVSDASLARLPRGCHVVQRPS